MTAFPIPNAALDDRLGWIGTSGSGKTYNAGRGVERLLQTGARVVIVDPLGVWWGLRLLTDGKSASPFNVAIFGGPHGDLPLNEHAGALIGETAATMAESCIIDLSELGSKAADRRFMVAFLETLYRKASGEPFHLVVDEADLFAPQKPAKGDEVLLSHMENIVRRGRVKGFIPWLISQRPAVLNKNVLSQVDGLIAFKLTATHDRNALDAWIEGQADVGQGKAIKDALPTFETGQGVVWLPGRGVLETATFPAKLTFDSSRTPKRGERKERRELKPLDLGALKGRLASVEEEAKANDPRALKARVVELERLIAGRAAAAASKGAVPGWPDQRQEATALTADNKRLREQMRQVIAEREHARGLVSDIFAIAQKLTDIPVPKAGETRPLSPAGTSKQDPPRPLPPREPRPAPASAGEAPQRIGGASLSGPQAQLMRAIAWWHTMGHEAPSRAQVAAIAGWRITSGHLRNVAGACKTAGLIDYPAAGSLALTDAGKAVAPEPDMSIGFHESLRAVLTGPQRLVLDHLLANGPADSREGICAALGWGATSGHFRNVVGSMKTLDLVDYPKPGEVRLQQWVIGQ